MVRDLLWAIPRWSRDYVFSKRSLGKKRRVFGQLVDDAIRKRLLDLLPGAAYAARSVA